MKVRDNKMNFNTYFAGFIGGLVCSSILFLVSRALKLPKIFKNEKVKDLSYFGRQPVPNKVRKLRRR